MNKIGILTYHYSNNYGGVIQSYALYSYLTSLGLNVEIINYIPSYVNLDSIFYETGLRKNILKMKKADMNPIKLFKRIYIRMKYSKTIINKFDDFRNYNLSRRVDENSFHEILNDYHAIIVGSDQVWSPGERNKKTYFLDYPNYKGLKISYAADSTVSEINTNHLARLTKALKDFDSISVRNEHSHKFAQTLLGKSVPIVVDPTLLWKFDEYNQKSNEKYILVYVLGKEISGTNKKAIEKIKKVYGDMKVYAIVIPTRKFEKCDYADEVIYDTGPIEWLNMFRNATFVFTDSFHGTLFSIKFRKPFLAYYAEELRVTRFIDLSNRYKIDPFIVNSLEDIDNKNSLNQLPDFDSIHQLIEKHKESSVEFIREALTNH